MYSLLLAVCGSMLGLLYAGLGFAAAAQLVNPTPGDKTYGWSLWWFLERSRYTESGQRLCTLGAVTFVAAAGCWLLWGVMRA